MKVTKHEQTILEYMKEIIEKSDEAGNFDLSIIEIKDIERLFKTPQTAVGVLGSLTKKGLVKAKSVNGGYNLYYLTGSSREYLGMQSEPQ